MNTNRRGFLQILGMAAAQPVVGGVPNVATVLDAGKQIATATVVGKKVFDGEIGRAIRGVLGTKMSQMEEAKRLFTGQGRDPNATPGTERKKIFDMIDIGRDILTGDKSIGGAIPDRTWVGELRNDRIRKLLQDFPAVSLDEFAGDFIEDVYREQIGDDVKHYLPDQETRKTIEDTLKKMTGAKGDEVISDWKFGQKVRERQMEVAKQVFEKMKYDPTWCPDEKRYEILDTLAGDRFDRGKDPMFDEIEKELKERGEKANAERKIKEAQEKVEQERKIKEEPSAREKISVRMVEDMREPSTFEVIVSQNTFNPMRDLSFKPIHALHFLQTHFGNDISPNDIELNSVKVNNTGFRFTLKNKELFSEIKKRLVKGSIFEMPDRVYDNPIIGLH